MATNLPAPVTTRWQSIRLLLQLPRVVRLCWRLFRDPRVGLIPKALLVGAVAYVVMPFDLIPDFAGPFGEMDDLALAVTAVHYFLSWCPRQVVDEHAREVGIRPDRLPGHRPD
jgi:uncharacterized membrane protein YkvA (DUF1232 family)